MRRLDSLSRQALWFAEQLKKKPSPSRILSYLFRRTWHLIRQLEPYRYRGRFSRREIADRIASLPTRPELTIVLQASPCTRVQRNRSLKSIARQLYAPSEICVAADFTHVSEVGRVTNLPVNRRPSGNYCVFLNLGDELCEDALFEIALAIQQNAADVIYSDEDFIGAFNRLKRPHFKPDFSPFYLLGYNYIGNLVAARTELVVDKDLLPDAPSAANNYLRTLRLARHAHQVHHVAKILCHTRFALLQGTDSEYQGLQTYLRQEKMDAEIETLPEPHVFRLRYRIRKTPLVSIMIPFRDKPQLLERCVRSILEKTGYPHYEIILISNQSEQPQTLRLVDDLERHNSRITLLHFDHPFNFSLINNFGSQSAKGEHLLLLNNDTEVIERDWLSALLEYSQMDQVGCVGAKLLYKSNQAIQHAGMIMDNLQVAHAHREAPGSSPGYFNRLITPQACTALTAACLMVKKSVYDTLGGLEEKLAVEFNDVDFCLRVREMGLENIWTPFSVLNHDECASRGLNWQDVYSEQAENERAFMHDRWGEVLLKDPYYNDNLKSLFRTPFSF
jgi:GT2 family glycosyltransferase